MITKVISDSGTEYTIDTEQLTCTCPHFMYRCSHRERTDEGRLCKHLSMYFDQHPEQMPIELAEKSDKLAMQMAAQQSPDGKIRYPRSMFDPYVNIILDTIDQFPDFDKVEICGSYRRMAPMVSDLDVLLTIKGIDTKEQLDNLINSPIEALFNYCENSLGFMQQWRGPLKGGYLIDGFVHVDFKLVPKESWAFSLCHFTGSKYENIELRRRALSKGVTLNEYGFFRDGERINGIFNTEEDIYNFLQLPYKLPQSR